MSKEEAFRKSARSMYKAMFAIFLMVGITTFLGIYVIVDPSLSSFSGSSEEDEIDYRDAADGDDTIENGIHLRTGLVEGEGLMEVVYNCTNCHSAKLVTQNRMTKERWKATIRWMQETQNLWDLGDNEEIIVNYLVAHYPPTKKGRRQNLTAIDWYELEN